MIQTHENVMGWDVEIAKYIRKVFKIALQFCSFFNSTYFPNKMYKLTDRKCSKEQINLEYLNMPKAVCTFLLLHVSLCLQRSRCSSDKDQGSLMVLNLVDIEYVIFH